MEDLFKASAKYINKAHESLVYTGKNREGDVFINIMDYNSKPDLFEEKSITLGAKEEIGTKLDNLINSDPDVVRWIDVIGIQRTDVIEKIGNTFGINILNLEDVLTVQNRPKLDDNQSYLYLLMKTMYMDTESTDVIFEQISVILGTNYVITFQEMENKVFDPLKLRIKSNKGRIRGMDSDYLLYTIIDCVVDNYFIVLEHIGNTFEELENEIISDTSRTKLKVLYKLKRENIALRNFVWPMREIVASLQKNESKLIRRKIYPYLHDLYDHIIQIIDTIENFRDLASGMLDIYLTSISNKTNETMKVLTIISTIFIPLTFIAGVYGMNFDFMPELSSPAGYPVIWIIMAAIAVFLLYWFRKKEWI